jgi:hypothetical protein
MNASGSIERQRTAGVLTRGVPRGVREQARACVGEPLTRRHVDVTAAQSVPELLQRAHRVRGAIDPTRLRLEQRLLRSRGELGGQQPGRQLASAFVALERGQRSRIGSPLSVA